jgi:hypothetical protein
MKSPGLCGGLDFTDGSKEMPGKSVGPAGALLLELRTDYTFIVGWVA